MEFKEYSNPEEADYDITSSLNGKSSEEEISKKFGYQLALSNLIGILEDIDEDELIDKYGITMEEYLHPTEEVLIKVIPTGNLQFGKAIDSITIDNNKITVYGDTETLNELTYVPVYVDVEGLKDNKTYKVEIEKPVGVKSMSVNNVTVTVTLGEVSTKKIEDVSIEPINLSDDYSVQGTDENATKVIVTLKGVKSVLDTITADDIQAYIDLQDYALLRYQNRINKLHSIQILRLNRLRLNQPNRSR